MYSEILKYVANIIYTTSTIAGSPFLSQFINNNFNYNYFNKNNNNTSVKVSKK